MNHPMRENGFIRVVCFIVMISLTMSRALAQESEGVGAILKSDGLMVLTDTRDFFTSPFRFTSEQWLMTGGTVTGTVLLFPDDESARTLFARNHSHIADQFAEFGRQYGREVYGLSFSGALYVGGLAFDNRDVRMTGIMLFESIAYAGITTTVVKTVLGRSRPFVEEGPYRFRSFQFNFERTSLPSGHSTVAFSVSSILAARLKNVYATVGLYTLATITAASRIYHDEHWFSDTLLGAAIGTASGLTVACMHEDESTSKSSLRITPTLNGIRAQLIF
jgi:membrane-associated phospholipid phosphatase